MPFLTNAPLPQCLQHSSATRRLLARDHDRGCMRHLLEVKCLYFVSPTPADAQAWATNERNIILATTRKEDAVLNDLAEIPEPGQEVPTSIRDIIGAYTVLPASNLPRPRLRARILFISGRR